MMELHEDGCVRLANQIVVMTAKDYRKALKALKKNQKNKAAMKMAMECEEFFASDWMKVLTDVDGEWLKQELRKEVITNDK